MTMQEVLAPVASDDALKVWINFVASLMLTGVLGAFLLFLFGRDNSFVYKLPGYKTLALKAGLAMCTMGALLNAVTVSNPPWPTVLLNSGLAVLFAWATWFHYSRFVKPWQEEQTAPKTVAAKSKRTTTKRALQKAVSGK
jgi:hypothetical protein